MPHKAKLAIALGALAWVFALPLGAQETSATQAGQQAVVAPSPSAAPSAAPSAQTSAPSAPAIGDDVSLYPALVSYEQELPFREPLPPGVDLNHPEHMTVAQRLQYGMAVEPKYDLNRIGSRGIGDGVNFYSIEKERVLGQQLANEVERGSSLVTDPVITEYVNRLGQQIVRNSDSRVPFTIKVLDNEEINAFALPGGYFYVNTGLILAADNEAELAGVMAHEIAHVAARHVTRNVTKAQIWNMASIPLIFLGGPAGYAIRQVAGIAVPMSFLKFSRDAEREADLLGLEYQYKAGYDPGAFVQFFEKLHETEKKKHSAFAKAFSTHPMNSDRIKDAQREINDDLPPRQDYIVTTSEFDEVKARLLALEDNHQIDLGRGMKPVLRKRTRPGSSTDKNGDAAGDKNNKNDKNKDPDDMPVLHRHDPNPDTQKPQSDQPKPN
jgi:predicted Zn-dependent protease